MLARDRGSKVTNAISTFTTSKISFPSLLSDRAEHQARQINCATKNKNSAGGFSHTASAKGEIDSTLLKGVLFFTTTLSKRILFSRRIFCKMYSNSLHYYSFQSFEKIFLSISQTSTLLKRVALLHKDLSQLNILDILMIK